MKDTTIRVDKDTLALAAEIADRFGITQKAVLEQAVAMMWRSHSTSSTLPMIARDSMGGPAPARRGEFGRLTAENVLNATTPTNYTKAKSTHRNRTGYGKENPKTAPAGANVTVSP